MNGESKSFRFYPSLYPKTNKIVMVEFNDINCLGAYVSLLEYNYIEGMIPLSELTKRRLKSYEKIVKAGKQGPAVVLRVDSELNYIDLSRRRVSREEAIMCDYRFQRAKIVHSILCQVSTKAQEKIETLYETLAWPLAKIYGSAFEAIQLMGQFPNEVFYHINDKPNKNVRTVLLETIKQKMIAQSLKIRSYIEINCSNYDGLLLIQEASRVTQNIISNIIRSKIEWKTIAAPLYLLSMLCFDEKTGIDILNHVIQEYTFALLSHGGHLNVKDQPYCMKSVK